MFEVINLIENKQQKEILIDSLKYLPDFLQDTALMKDASKLLNACLSEETDVLAQIYQAYCDTLYKIAGYQQLSYGAKTALIKEKGFDYLLNLLRHIYEERYNQLSLEERKKITLDKYLEQQTNNNLTNITMLFNLLYILKGKTLGLELALELVNCPEYIYLTWDIVANYKGEWPSLETLPLPGGDIDVQKGDCYTVPIGATSTDVIFNGVSWHKCTSYKQYLTPRQPFTAQLTIWGSASASLQAEIAEFVRYYMLPWIEVKLEFTANMDAVYCFPSGDRSLLRSYVLSNYYEDNGTHVKKDLEHVVSDASWKYTQYATDITVGQPIFNNIGFQGTVDLNDSFVQRGDKKYYLYGQSKVIPDFITGPALSKLTKEGTLINFDGDYVQAPLQQDYVLVDIVIGNQINPYYDENGEFIRDTIIKYNTCLLVEGIHHAKTIEQMNSLLIEDFDKDLEQTEVYAGRITEVHCENPAGVMFFETSDPVVREKVGVEDTIHLQFTDVYVKDYTGIGDLGILGSNSYFIYNNMLYLNTENGPVQVDTQYQWKDVGASHAVSETYFTPAIHDGKLVYLKDTEIFNMERDANSYGNYISHVETIPMPVEVVDELENDTLNSMTLDDFNLYLDLSYWDNIELNEANWTHVTGYTNEYYTAYAICDGRLYQIYLVDGVPHYAIKDEEQGWTYITGAYYRDTYEAYGVKNGVMYTIGQEIIPVSYNGETLQGWDTSFDCISRYHHSNNEFITYGICDGKLYYLQNNNVGLMSEETCWTAICGFYDESSPRTFAYAIKNNALYELQGTTLVLKDDTHNWTDISGCTSSAKTYVLGIADENLYIINAKTLKLVDEGGWTDVMGRTTTYNSKSANCYGYGIKNNRFVILHKDSQYIISGMWKVDGVGPAVDLSDYNIENIAVRKEDGTYIEGIDNVRTQVPLADEPLSTYDIYVTYKTTGFEDNTRYQVKTEMSEVYFTYVNPEESRDDVDMSHAPEWDSNTGILNNFTNCPLIIHGNQKINGKGDAYEFLFEQSYLELPNYYNIIEGEYEPIYEYKPFEEVTLKLGCIVDNNFYPLVLDKDGTTGIYYGFNEQLQRSGIFVKSINNENTETYTRIIPVNLNENIETYIKYIRSGNYYNLAVSNDNKTYNTVFISGETYLNSPKYLGGNGEEYGDGIFFLLDCSMVTDETIPMYEVGKYFSVNTLGMDTIERFLTPVSQECQKVVEIQDEQGNFVIDFGMDNMYVSRTFSCTNDTLQISDDFCYNDLHYGRAEGINTSTLTFSGEYILDPEKAQAIGDIESLSNYNITTIANNFSASNYININPNITDSLVIQTGDVVDNQILFQTEEDNAYTNNYLLIADTDVTSNRNQAHVVPSGLMFEMGTDLPGQVTHSLEYNAERFEIDETLIEYPETIEFDDYTALMYGFSTYVNSFCTIDLTLTQTEKEGIITRYDCLPIFKVTLADSVKQKIAQIAEQDIIIGNKDIKYYNEDGEEIPNPNEQEGPIDEDLVYTTEEVIDPDFYPFEDNTSYYIKIEIERQDRGVQNIVVHETTSTEEKDHFTFVHGVIDNFSKFNYLETQNLTSKYGLQLCFITDDDVSKDQGLIGKPGAQSVCIKDNLLTLCDKQGNVLEQATDFYLSDKDTFYLYFSSKQEDEEISSTTLQNNVYVYVKNTEDESYYKLFENPIVLEDSMWIGYASAGSGMIPFNGSLDMTRSYMESPEIERLYDFTQITTFLTSLENDDNYEPFYEVETPYADNQLLFGFDFNGSLDMLNSITTGDYGFLLPYTLGWLENRTYIDTVIKQALQEADPSYDPELDSNTYTLKEYGIHLTDEPQRWDNVFVTYNTVDHAYYMEPNTTYYLTCETELDENGKCLLDKVGNPIWKSGIVSGLNNENYYTYQFTNEQYLVINCSTTNVEDQILCKYTDENSQNICIKDGKWQYFDENNYFEITDAKENTNYWFKIPTISNKLEYSLDGEVWTETNISLSFTGYDILNIGQSFNGFIDLNTSYFIINDSVNYLFTLYKKVTPMISTDNQNWTPIVLTPLLTLKDMIAFGQGFNGSLDLYNSNLLLEDTTYWTCNRVNVYALYDMPEDDIKANDLVEQFIIDDCQIDSTKYWSEDETIQINPKDLKLNVSGLPKIGDVITLTYDTWFLFREMNHEYDFKLLYDRQTNRASITYEDVATGLEYKIYEMDAKNYIINSGYNFWGSLLVKDSTRGGMILCEYLEWYRYIITYRKYGDTEWTKWSEFSVESRYELNKRTGYELDGLLYMETSYVKLGNLITPFLSHWNGTFINIVGAPMMDNGVVSNFTAEDYLAMKMDALQNGDIVSFDVTFNSLEDQGIGTLFYLQDGYVCSGGQKLQQVYEGFVGCIEYHVENGRVYARFIGRNTTNFILAKSDAYTLTLIPYNYTLNPVDNSYYVRTEQDAEKLSIYYRLGDQRYDHYNPPALDWYKVALQFVDSLDYYGTTLQNLYVAVIHLGYEYDHAGNPTNTNPDNLEYLDSQPIEYKIVSTDGLTTTNHTSLYTNKVEKQRTIF